MSRILLHHVRHALPGLRRVTALVTLMLLGAMLGLLLGGTAHRQVGPFDADLSIRPSWTGGTKLFVAPLGTIALDSHDGPIELQVRVTQLREAAARRIAANPTLLERIGAEVQDDVESAVIAVVVRSVVVALLGAAVVTALFWRRPRMALLAVLLALSSLLAVAGTAAATWREDALAEPEYTGLLTQAPAAVGGAEDIVRRFQLYQRQLGRLVTNVSELYATASTLPSFVAGDDTIRVLQVSDLHLNPAAFDVIRSVVKQFGVAAVADTGDITDWGSEPEARYVAGIGRVGVPYVYIRGNHDSLRTQAAVAAQRNAVVLDGQVEEVAGLRFLGVGDPRFTPDKSTRDDEESGAEALERVGRELADTAASAAPDIVLIHDPKAAPPLFGTAPVVLSGHVHKRERTTENGTVHLVEGSTGGAGLRGLEGEEPTPIMCTVLYLDRTTHRLRAYDSITLGGLGESEVRIARTVVPETEVADATVARR